MFSSPVPGLEGAPQFSSGSMMGSMIWMIAALALVVGLIVLLIRFMSKRSQLWSGPRAMKSLGGLTLAQGKSIQLVEAAGRIYVLGVGDDVAALDVISDPEAVEAVRKQLAAQEAAAAARPAAEWMKLLQDKLTGSKQPEAGSGEGADAKRFETMLQQKLEQQSRQQEELEQLLQETRDRERLREE